MPSVIFVLLGRPERFLSEKIRVSFNFWTIRLAANIKIGFSSVDILDGLSQDRWRPIIRSFILNSTDFFTNFLKKNLKKILQLKELNAIKNERVAPNIKKNFLLYFWAHIIWGRFLNEMIDEIVFFFLPALFGLQDKKKNRCWVLYSFLSISIIWSSI